ITPFLLAKGPKWRITHILHRSKQERKFSQFNRTYLNHNAKVNDFYPDAYLCLASGRLCSLFSFCLKQFHQFFIRHESKIPEGCSDKLLNILIILASFICKGSQ